MTREETIRLSLIDSDHERDVAWNAALLTFDFDLSKYLRPGHHSGADLKRAYRRACDDQVGTEFRLTLWKTEPELFKQFSIAIAKRETDKQENR